MILDMVLRDPSGTINEKVTTYHCRFLRQDMVVFLRLLTIHPTKTVHQFKLEYIKVTDSCTELEVIFPGDESSRIGVCKSSLFYQWFQEGSTCSRDPLTGIMVTSTYNFDLS